MKSIGKIDGKLSGYEYRFVNEHGEVWVAHITDDFSVAVTSNDLGWGEKIFRIDNVDAFTISDSNIFFGNLMLGKNEIAWLFSVYLVAKEMKKIAEKSEER